MAAKTASIPVILVSSARWEGIAAGLGSVARTYAAAQGFEGKSGRVLALPGSSGGIEAVLLGTGDDEGLAGNPFLAGKLANELPAGRYRLEGPFAEASASYLACLNGAYRFTKYKTSEAPAVTFDPPTGCESGRIERIARAVAAGRDLINTPANEMTTEALAAAAHALAARFGARVEEIVGDALLKENFPLIYTVGRAAAGPPRLISIRWGDPSAPRVALVGKGVVFDTGGLNLKPDSSMLLMKKDMGGAAAAMTAAEIVMGSGAKINLHLVLPIVENAVAGNAFRPGDIYRSRKGLTVEIGNTDAEGRLILADALAYADEDGPELMIDFATLTGAARVALGPDLPPFYTDDETLAEGIAKAGASVHDPVWRLPLWKPYLSMFESKVADLNNAGAGGFAGSITAALFLQRFVTKATSWAHFDIYGWTPAAKPGRPEGGDPQAARLVASLIEEKYAAP